MKNIFLTLIVNAVLLLNFNFTMAQETFSESTQLSDCSVLPQINPTEISCNEFQFEPIVIINEETLIVNYFWNFGDGNTSLDQNPTHEYAENGTYTVTLTVTGVDIETGECCCKTTTIVVNVECGCELGTEFNFTTNNCNEYAFTASTTPNNVTTVIGYFWEIGDDISYTEQNPTHVFDESGEYEVTLTTIGFDNNTGECCCSSTTQTVTVDCLEQCGSIYGFTAVSNFDGTQEIFLETNDFTAPGWDIDSYEWTIVNNNTNQVIVINDGFIILNPGASYEVSLILTLTDEPDRVCILTHTEIFDF